MAPKNFAALAALSILMSTAAWAQNNPGTDINCAAVDPQTYVLGPADILFIKVYDADRFTGPQVVRPDGKISLYLLNEIQAAGLTPQRLQDQLKVALAEYLQQPEVLVTVSEVNREVSHPRRGKPAGFLPAGCSDSGVRCFGQWRWLQGFRQPERHQDLARRRPDPAFQLDRLHQREEAGAEYLPGEWRYDRGELSLYKAGTEAGPGDPRRPRVCPTLSFVKLETLPAPASTS